MAELNVSITRTAATELQTPLLVLQLFERDEAPEEVVAEVDRRMDGAISRVLEQGDFRGTADEALVLYPRGDELGARRVLLVGVGKREDYTAEGLRRAMGVAVRQAERLGVDRLAAPLAAVDRISEHLGSYHAALAAVEGATLAAWNYRELKTGAGEGEQPETQVDGLVLVASDDAEAEEFERAAAYGRVVAEAENLARLLATRPGNVATPSHLAEIAEGLAQEYGLDLTVLDREAMREERLHALLAVAQGSREEPRFIVLEHRGGAEDEAPLVLVGKGVTFDSGGISIKPSQKMEEMKYDMSGAAAVLGAMRAVGELQLPINVVGIVPSTENLPSGTAVKPGDVIRSHGGKSIEVINTDAEGRLILADALSYAQRYRPRAMVDAATLTGACVTALGHHAIGLMGNDTGVVEAVRHAGERVGARCWQLPLWDDYRRQLDSTVADIKNTGGRPAGTITAGWFLKEFVGDVPWAHLDIAGTAWLDEPPPYLHKGATGVPTRLFVEWIRAHIEG